MITRRCTRRTFMLKPTPGVTKIVTYCLAVAVERYGIRLHSAAVESTHYHLTLTDPRGKLPDFERDFDSLVARALNAAYGRGEYFWAPSSFSSVELPDRASILEKMVYVAVNPTKDGLVSHPRKWPGLITLPSHAGTRVIGAEKPKSAFFGGRRSRTPTPRRKGRRRRRKRGWAGRSGLRS